MTNRIEFHFKLLFAKVFKFINHCCLLNLGIDSCCDILYITLHNFTLNNFEFLQVADFGSQALICHQLHAVFPNDPIVAEETSDELLKPDRRQCLRQVIDYVKQEDETADEKSVIEWINHGNGKVARRFWTLDPIGERILTVCIDISLLSE